MDPIILVVVVVLVAIAGLAFVATRTRPSDPDLDTRAPEAPARPPETAPTETAPPPPAADTETFPPTVAHTDIPGTPAPVDVEPAPTPAEPEPEPEPARPPRFRDRLGKARDLLGGYFTSIRGRGVDAETWDELEEALIRADVGVATATELVERVRTAAKDESLTEPDQILDRLKTELGAALGDADRSLRFDGADGQIDVWLFVGVNGVGKTTTIGKVSKQQAAEGRKPMLAAGDTFRAAAAEQLGTWAERTGAEIIRGSEGGDPSSVIFDAVAAAQPRGCDLVLADTAGRLHTKVNLMEELSKVRRVADRDPGNVTEVLLVIDATTGQNGLAQAREFTEATQVTGVVLTKLDGTAKGGIALAIERELGIPVKLVGLGETVDDLVVFDPSEFVDALFA